jgi:DNA-binding phage protein
MAQVIRQTSRSYHDFLIESLKLPEGAAGYLEAILEEKDPEPGLLPSAIDNLVEAHSDVNAISDETKHRYEKLSAILGTSGGAEIYALIDFLESLGLMLSITGKSTNQSL